ncbi:MAG TPA: hypothetical protein VNE62_10065 [Actinomycetota bacterium]|nr:hypothetical protein [Actinomycetota bacterium]
MTDTHGQPVYVEVFGDSRVGQFCGETSEPVYFRPGSTLEIYVGLATGRVSGHTCPANIIKTSGTIRVTLSNLP